MQNRRGGMGDGGLGLGNWGLGIGDCQLGPIPNPQPPIPNPQSPIPNPQSPCFLFKCLKLKENNSDLLRVISKASLNADLVSSIDSDNQLPFIPSHHKETHRIIKSKKMKLNNIDFCNSKLNKINID